MRLEIDPPLLDEISAAFGLGVVAAVILTIIFLITFPPKD